MHRVLALQRRTAWLWLALYVAAMVVADLPHVHQHEGSCAATCAAPHDHDHHHPGHQHSHSHSDPADHRPTHHRPTHHGSAATHGSLADACSTDSSGRPTSPWQPDECVRCRFLAQPSLAVVPVVFSGPPQAVAPLTVVMPPAPQPVARHVEPARGPPALV